jgi:rare lipoprotein A
LATLLLFISTEIFSQVLPYNEKGKASFYANLFHGRITANGEVFNNLDLTAAHLTLPFGTYVNVTSESTGRNVIVRINDRGPYIKNRLIDLSQAAIRMLNGYDQGVIDVRINTLNLIQNTEQLKKIYGGEKLVNSLGHETKSEGYALSLWHTSDLVHAIYFANDLYVKEPVNKVLIKYLKTKNRAYYYICIDGIESEQEQDKLKREYYTLGYTRVRKIKL